MDDRKIKSKIKVETEFIRTNSKMVKPKGTIYMYIML